MSRVDERGSTTIPVPIDYIHTSLSSFPPTYSSKLIVSPNFSYNFCAESRGRARGQSFRFVSFGFVRVNAPS